MDKPKILITNDDGIESHFLKILVEAHQRDFDVYVAAPANEQSWKGRGFSRHSPVEVEECPDYNCPAWAIAGTTSDCVNLALGHLLGEGQMPDAVISGINIGFNSGIPYILTSGTIAGALEGALWGIPALAYSHMIPQEIFENVSKNKGQCSGALLESLKSAATHAVSFTKDLLNKETEAGIKVHNINFPETTSLETTIEKTIAGNCFIGNLFQKEAKNKYAFRFSKPVKKDDNENTDYACLLRGNISHSILDFSLAACRT